MQRFRKISLFRPAFLIIGLMLMFTLAACRPPPAPIASSDNESAPTEEVVVAPADTPEPVDTPTPVVDVERISVEDTKALLDAGDAVIVDARTNVEYERGHIPGAVSIPRSEIESRMEELPREAKILLYCTWLSEQTSAGAARILLANGFTDAKAVLGGLKAWEDAGYPIEVGIPSS